MAPFDVRWSSLYTHNNGTYSHFPFQFLRVDRDNQKHDLAWELLRCLVIVFIYRCHFDLFCFISYSLIHFGPRTLLPSSLTINSLFSKSESPLHFCSLTLQGDTSSTLHCGDWSDNERILYSIIYPTRCNFTQFIYIWKLLYIFRVVPPPIIRSTIAAGSSNGMTNTRCCRYSCMRLELFQLLHDSGR